MALVVHDVEAAPDGGHARRVRPGEGGGLLVWCGLVVAALAWGTVAVRNRDVGLHAAPFKGHWAWHGGWRLLPALGLGGAICRWGPSVAVRLRWRWVPVATGAVASVWTAALAAGDGVDRLTDPLTTRFEYEPFAAGLGHGDLGRFLSSYVDRLGGYPIHVQGHPPGPVVLAWALDRTGLGGAGWLAALTIGCWGVAVAATLITARAVAGESAARRAAPALAVLPAAVWAGTSLDPVFAALGAVAVALAVHATLLHGATSAAGATARAVGAGLVFGAALLCSYGAVPFGLVLVAAVVAAGRAVGRSVPVGPLAAVGLGALAALAVAARAGFWWPAGLEATRTAYWEGIGSRRPGLYLTLLGNPAALAIAVGPLVALGLGALAVRLSRTGRRPVRPATADAGAPDAGAPDAGGLQPLAIVVGAALVAVAAADLSQLARGEVERIWLPFVPWLALAAPGDRRGWLAAQVVVALAVQSSLVSPW